MVFFVIQVSSTFVGLDLIEKGLQFLVFSSSHSFNRNLEGACIDEGCTPNEQPMEINGGSKFVEVHLHVEDHKVKLSNISGPHILTLAISQPIELSRRRDDC